MFAGKICFDKDMLGVEWDTRSPMVAMAFPDKDKSAQSFFFEKLGLFYYE
jgi:hypothetical protein